MVFSGGVMFSRRCILWISSPKDAGCIPLPDAGGGWSPRVAAPARRERRPPDGRPEVARAEPAGGGQSPSGSRRQGRGSSRSW
jgi:hypothetical protein